MRVRRYDWQGVSMPANLQAYRIQQIDGTSVRTVVSSPFRKKFVDYLASIDYGSVLLDGGNDDEVEIFSNSFKNPRCNPGFEKRRCEGEIVVADYDVFKSHIEASCYKVTSRRLLSTPMITSKSGNFLEPLRFQEVTSRALRPTGNVTKDWCSTDFTSNLETLSDTVVVRHEELTTSKASMEEVFGISGQALENQMIDTLFGDCVNPIMVQSTLANANNGEMDLLTELAEVPDTVRSIVNGLTAMKALFLSAKHKQFSLTQTSLARTQKLREIHRSQGRFLSKKDFIKANGNLRGYHKQRTKFLNNTQRKKDAEDFYDKLGLAEAADAFASVWLTYRYAISPIAYSISDYADALYKAGRFYASFDNKERLNLAIHPLFKGEAYIDNRVWIKRRYRVNSFLEDMRVVLNTNILNTAVELIPIWGIVANWFITVRDFMNSIDINPHYSQQAATASNRMVVDGELVSTDGLSRVSIKFDGYTRVKIKPVQHIGLYFRSDLNIKRQLDALAFGWVLTKGSKTNKDMLR